MMEVESRHERLKSCAENLQETVLQYATEMIKNHSDSQRQNSCTLSFDFERVEFNERDETWVVSGSYESDGVDMEYIFRSPQRARDSENTYLYSDEYGWSYDFTSPHEILSESILFENAVQSAFERELLTESEVREYRNSVDEFQDQLQTFRFNTGLDDVSYLITESDWQSTEYDILETLLVSNDDESQRLWTLLFSKPADEILENNVHIECHDSDLMLVRSERHYEDANPVGFVIGIDDTDERFFMHRLNTDKNLKDMDYDWKVADIRSKMGFEIDYTKDDFDEIPTDTWVRVQGDLRFKKYPISEIEYEYVDVSTLEVMWSELGEDIDVDKYTEHQYINAMSKYSRTPNMLTITDRASTDDLKEIQDEFNISEDLVRSMQEDKSWSRLTSNRRKQIVENILNNRIIQDAVDNPNYKQDVQSELRDEFTEEKQVNSVLGNHTIFAAPANETPSFDSEQIDFEDSEGVITICSDDANMMIVHDEHDNKNLNTGRGVYMFDFLNGFQTMDEMGIPRIIQQRIRNSN